MLWRIRAQLDDRPGTLAALAGCCGDEGVNILALQVFPSTKGVVDELVVSTPHGWSARAVEALALRAGACDPRADVCTPHALQDTAVRYLRAAQVVMCDPQTLPEQLCGLLGAEPGPRSGRGLGGGGELVLDDGYAPPVHLVRDVPFSATETARGAALRDVTTTAPASRAAEDPPGEATTSVLRDGTSRDTAMLVAMHTRCSGETVQRRYHMPMPHLSPRLAHALLTPVGGQSMVMATSDAIVGIATLAPDVDGEFEVGLLVEDRWQRQGIGSRLLLNLADQAAQHGITRLTCHVQPDNQALLATIRRTGFHPRITLVDGLLQVRIPLTRLLRSQGAQANTTGMGKVTHNLVPLLHARQELSEISPVANMIDHAVREGT